MVFVLSAQQKRIEGLLLFCNVVEQLLVEEVKELWHLLISHVI